MALVTTEPTNGYGYHGCGYCATWAQELAPLLDAEGQPVLHPETGQPMVDNDQAVSSAELFQHMADAHPEVA